MVDLDAQVIDAVEASGAGQDFVLGAFAVDLQQPAPVRHVLVEDAVERA